jgi:hypothetical protein
MQYPTDRFVNARRTVMVFLSQAAINARVIDALDPRQSTDVGGAFVRVSLSDGPAVPAGPGASTRSGTTLRSIMVSCECYCPDITDGQPTAIDSAIALADSVSAALYRQNIEIKDYAIPAATATGAYLQFHRPPVRPDMPSIKGWFRAALRIQANWFAEQT